LLYLVSCLYPVKDQARCSRNTSLLAVLYVQARCYSYLKKVPEGMSKIPLEEQYQVYKVLSPLLTVDSMIGFTYQKPHGYAGDFELIDRIYCQRTSKNKNLYKWDMFYHNLEAAIAVRNRKKYFKNLVDHTVSKIEAPHVLNLGSGPCSDLYEYLQGKQKIVTKFDCLDMDQLLQYYPNHGTSQKHLSPQIYRYFVYQKLYWLSDSHNYVCL